MRYWYGGGEDFFFFLCRLHGKATQRLQTPDGVIPDPTSVGLKRFMNMYRRAKHKFVPPLENLTSAPTARRTMGSPSSLSPDNDMSFPPALKYDKTMPVANGSP